MNGPNLPTIGFAPKGCAAGRLRQRTRPADAHFFLTTSRPVPIATLLCLVIAVSDGDTLTARCGAQRPIQVRVAAIDAPERKQAFGTPSRQNLTRLCLRQKATLQTVARDAYGRTVAHVQCGNGDAAAAQVRAGLAWVYTPRASRYPQLAALQRQAQVSHTGLWSQKRPRAPWDYRRQHPRG